LKRVARFWCSLPLSAFCFSASITCQQLVRT
jgi:hypothetical protein